MQVVWSQLSHINMVAHIDHYSRSEYSSDKPGVAVVDNMVLIISKHIRKMQTMRSRCFANRIKGRRGRKMGQLSGV